MEFVDFFPDVSFIIITNKNGKYELTDKLPKTTEDLWKSQNSMELQSSVQSSSQNENIVNTSKKLLKTRYWTFLLLHCKSCLVSIWNARLSWNVLKQSRFITVDFKLESAKKFPRKFCQQNPKFKRKFQAVLEIASWERFSCTPSL